jgi:hypothetical protein
MAYWSHHCFATLLCSTCISVFLHTFLTLYVLFPFMLCAPCPFYAPLLFCSFQLLHSASFYPHKSLSIVAPISSLFYILIVYVHLVHALCAILLNALHLAIFLHIEIFTTTPHCHRFTTSRINTLSLFCMLSSCRVLFQIIIASLQLLWPLNPCVHHHWVLCRDSLACLEVETLHLLYHSRDHPLCCIYRLQHSSICQSPL